MTFPAITIDNTTGGQASAPTFHDNISFAGPASYSAGGEAGFVTAFQLKTKSSRDPISVQAVGPCGGYVPFLDRATGKLVIYKAPGDAGPLIEVTAATDLSGVTFTLAVVSQ